MPRQKTIFGSHRQLAHVWAQQNQPEGRSSDGRMFFEGPTLYSYGRHYAIARFTKDKRGNPIVLFNSSGYSSSTATHTRYARAAVSIPTVDVRDPLRDPQDTIDDIDRGIADHVKEYAGTSHAGRKAKLIKQLEDLLSRRNAIGNALIKGYRVKTLPKDLKKHAAKIHAAEKAAAEKAEAKRLADIEARLSEAEKILGAKRDAWPEMWRDHFTPGGEATHEYCQAWRRAEWFLQDATQPILMRLRRMTRKGDAFFNEDTPTTIETSRGAEFPIDAALRALPIIRRMRKTKKRWDKNGEQVPLGSFAIDTIFPNGDVKAGCHLVTYREVEHMAAILKEGGLT